MTPETFFSGASGVPRMSSRLFAQEKRAGLGLRDATATAARDVTACCDGRVMPVADYAQYCEMLERARLGKFALPAINVSSLTTANAVLRGLAQSQSDGIIQVSTGGGALASGTAIKTLEGGTVMPAVTGNTYDVNNAHVVCGNVQTANATVYIINTVLMPPSS